MNKQEETKRQPPFLIDMTFPTSEMLGKHILSKLETTRAWVLPIYEETPATEAGDLREQIAKTYSAICENCGIYRRGCSPCSILLEQADSILSLITANIDQLARETVAEVLYVEYSQSMRWMQDKWNDEPETVKELYRTRADGFLKQVGGK